MVQENGRRMAFLESWAFVADTARPRILGPCRGQWCCRRRWRPKCWTAASSFRLRSMHSAGEQGIRDAQGAWGVLTRNLITRQDVLRTAVINAFAPFFNAALYSR